MLRLALKARVPLIKVSTSDSFTATTVLSNIVPDGTTVFSIPSSSLEDSRGREDSSWVEREFPSSVYLFCDFVSSKHYAFLYALAEEYAFSVVLLDTDDPHGFVFDGGELVVPDFMIRDMLGKLISNKEEIATGVSLLRGLSYKAMAEVCRLAQTKHGHVGGTALADIRHLYSGSIRGVERVSSINTFYSPDDEISNWLKVDGLLFSKADVPASLVPRGLLFQGLPGTGKTAGAKYLASALNLPLYRLDLGSLMNKYVGGSESNLAGALAHVDAMAPCLLLLDEVEKVFVSSDDSGVSSRLLSALLWWLQEHQSRVLTIMTTNNWKALPKELYRAGRVDRVIAFTGVAPGDFLPFIQGVAGDFPSLDPNLLDQALEETIKELSLGTGERPQSEIVEIVHTRIKMLLAESYNHQ